LQVVFKKQEISQQVGLVTMQDLASEFSIIFRGWYARSLIAKRSDPIPHPTPRPASGASTPPRCWDPNLVPPQLFSRGCALTRTR